MRPESGEELKNLGMRLALDNAGYDWQVDMLEKMRIYAETHESFLIEDFRAEALVQQWPAPPSSKCWGPLASAAAKAGIIESTEQYEKAKSRATHAHPVLRWKAAK